MSFYFFLKNFTLCYEVKSMWSVYMVQWWINQQIFWYIFLEKLNSRIFSWRFSKKCHWFGKRLIQLEILFTNLFASKSMTVKFESKKSTHTVLDTFVKSKSIFLRKVGTTNSVQDWSMVCNIFDFVSQLSSSKKDAPLWEESHKKQRLCMATHFVRSPRNSS